MVASELRAGDIAIVSYETDVSVPASPDGLRFVLLKPIGSGTQIFFTDRAWTGSGLHQRRGRGHLHLHGRHRRSAPAPSSRSATPSSRPAASRCRPPARRSTSIRAAPTRRPASCSPLDVADGNTTFNGNLTGTGLTNGINAVAHRARQCGLCRLADRHRRRPILAAISNNIQWYGTRPSTTIPARPISPR